MCGDRSKRRAIEARRFSFTRSHKFFITGTKGAKQQPDRYILTVKDTGAGMRQALMEWCKGVEQKQSAGQTGTGLLIVNELVSLVNANYF